MKKFLTNQKGLSMTDATFFSNKANQIASDLERQLNSYNPIEKIAFIDGKKYITENCKLFDVDVDLIQHLVKLRGLQAYLMEALKEKDRLLKEHEATEFVYDVPAPVQPNKQDYFIKNQPQVDEDWAFRNILSEKERIEYVINEAAAASIGKLIHKDGVLQKARRKVETQPLLEFIDVKMSEKTPVSVTIHHNSSDITLIINELANKHRVYEKVVNKFKAIMRNAVSARNAEIQKELSIEASKQHTLFSEANELYLAELAKYNMSREAAFAEWMEQFNIKKQQLSSLKIVVPAELQEVIDWLND